MGPVSDGRAGTESKLAGSPATASCNVCGVEGCNVTAGVGRGRGGGGGGGGGGGEEGGGGGGEAPCPQWALELDHYY